MERTPIGKLIELRSSLEVAVSRTNSSIRQKRRAGRLIDWGKIEEAFEFSRKCHVGQFRKDETPYFFHPAEVALKIALADGNEEQIISGLLHDVVEDKRATLHEVRTRFGDKVAEIVSLTTKEHGSDDPRYYEKHTAYLERLLTSGNMDAIIVKTRDVIHNLQTLPDSHTERVKYLKKYGFLLAALRGGRFGVWRDAARALEKIPEAESDPWLRERKWPSVVECPARTFKEIGLWRALATAGPSSMIAYWDGGKQFVLEVPKKYPRLVFRSELEPKLAGLVERIS
ncbi:MAG: HD domain-containing protein, partial [Candidatus Micrarchaeota archaeon]